jgi:preprotein translocase subunit SecG
MLFAIMRRGYHGHTGTPRPHGQAQLFGIKGHNGCLHRIFIILSVKFKVKAKIQTRDVFGLLPGV